MTELTQGVNELIERIKSEGVTQAKAEKNRMISEAREEAARLISEAKSDAESILTDANKQCEALRARIDSELRLSVRDFVAKFQQQIKDHLIRPVIAGEVTQVMRDDRFLTDTLQAILLDYAKPGSGQAEVTVDAGKAKKLGTYFSKLISDKLAGESSLSVKAEDGLTGFRLRREGEGFTWDFTLEAIVTELQALVEPELKPFFTLGGSKH